MEHFVLWMVYLIKRIMNFISWRTFHIFGWVFGVFDEIIGILDSEYAIRDDYLVFERIYFIR